MILSLYTLFILTGSHVDFWDMPQNLPVRVRVHGYHLSLKIVSSVRGFVEDTDFYELGRQLLTEFGSMHQRISRFADKALGGEMAVMRALILAGGSLTPSELADRAWVSSARIANILRALEAKGWVEREHSKTDRRRVHVTVTDKGFHDLEIKRREFEDRTAAFLEQLGETDTQEMVRLLRRFNEIIDRNQERRDAE